ncbi:TRAP transporter substrate-binding protein DctP [Nannocystis sp. RBIL2]|uniref:TRAP transporter substrate-binding protein DctP n=1 Tax=Nannocystis sp. RBIL2 TaxID=2996788 RepID=UPI002270CB49|nr:TRAP transporter substrate-binding protein DctP [Nannocystis sp. RBIL2]MCY1065267.1 TRAP transporter substrate-binding protein DctP [Nannocystis sp. RBIL2]
MHGRRCRLERRPRQAPQARARPADAGPVHHLGEARRRPRRVGRGARGGAPQPGAAAVGWCDVGMVSIFSRGFPVRPATSLKGRKPWLLRDDPIVKALYQSIGGVTAVPLSAPEVLPRLDTSAVNAVLQSPLAVEQLQWASKLDTITDLAVGPRVGAIVLSQKRLDALPADLRAIVLDTGKIAANALQTRARQEDTAALARLKGMMTVVSLTADERGFWNARFKQTRQILAQGTFSPELVARLESMA